MAGKLPFIIESSVDGKTWTRVDERGFSRAKDAYPHAVHAWKKTKRLLRTSKYCSLFHCDLVRVRRADSNRAVHAFPRIRTEYHR